MIKRSILCTLLFTLVPLGACDPPAGETIAVGTPAADVIGHTLTWRWDDGPFAGASYRGVFRADGTVTWTGLTGDDAGVSATGKAYGAAHLSRDVVVVSWLERIGYTVTHVLDFESMAVLGITSNASEWYTGNGSFEVH